MTVLDGIELDVYTRNPVKDAIKHNEPLDEVLHVIMVVSNPCFFKRRYQLARQFMLRMEREENIQLYVVELCYGKQRFVLTQKRNLRHLQLRTEHPLWHKENMVNCGVKLLPKSWKAMAWIDADIEFESNTWALDALKLLNGHADMVQLFSHCVDMDKNELAMSVVNSAGYPYEKGTPHRNGLNYWHPGYAWACHRTAYEKMGGLYENAILGSGDNIMMCSLLGQASKSVHDNNEEAYKQDVLDYQTRVKQFRFSYVPGVIRHYYHGAKVNRRYKERWQILVDHHYNPLIHVKKNKDGLLVPTEQCPAGLLNDILEYFKARNEDE
jgi:hypothetical protein